MSCAKRVVFIFLILVFTACGSKRIYKDEFIALGSYLEVISPHKEAAGLVYNEVKRLEKIFSAYDPDSELSRLNSSYRGLVPVSDEMIEVLLLAGDLNRLTQGAFDVSCGAVYQQWKKVIDSPASVRASKVETLLFFDGLCGTQAIEIDVEGSRAGMKEAGAKIDLGGIAKGYIVDKSVELLKANGLKSALINAGGDLYCLGENNYRKWRVGLQIPGQASIADEAYQLENQAMATSGDYEQFFELDGNRYSHIIDPRSGLPVKGRNMSVSVIAPTAALADSLATAFYVLGPGPVGEIIKESGLEIKVIISEVDESGKLSQKKI
jgi:FAD:protein FMN transferase